MTARPDIVLLTVDCWRYDAVTRMHELRSVADDSLDRTEVVCQSAATPGVFPAMLGSEYYVSAYGDDDTLADDLTTLSALLSKAGYATGAFVANNPFLERFRDEFDTFSNGGSWTDDDYRRAYAYLKRQFHRRVRHRSTVPAPVVRRAAADWFRSTDGPRFLLMHLMDPHEPYYPGLRRWLSVGPRRARQALAQFQADRLSMDQGQQATAEELYWLCVDFVDAHMRSLLSFVPDDALVVVTGDHGEEFEHGAYRHARLYDECVRVPLFVRNLPDMARTDRVRQLDLAPSIVNRLGLSAPEGWQGSPCDGTTRESFMLNHSPHRGESYLGVRTDRYKYIRTIDAETGSRTGTELYDLATDPLERRNLADTERADAIESELAAKVTSFREEHNIDASLSRGTRAGSGVESAPPEAQLKALGYI